MNTIPKGFKSRTIVKIIKTKINEWLEEVAKKDKTLAEDIRDDYILTGGAITSLLLGEEPNDFDIYFQTPEVAKRVVEFYLDGLVKNDKVNQIEARIIDNNQVSIMIKSIGVVGGETANDEISSYDYFENQPVSDLDEYLVKWATKKQEWYKPALFTSNAITLYGGIQLVTRFVGKPEEIHKNYDFIHCTNWYTANEGLKLNQPALEAILARELKYVGSLYPVASMFRLRKFINRGWTITAGEMFKIAYDISKLDLNSYKVLQDQLIGVDVAYFSEILRILRTQSDKSIDRTYLFETINRIFDESEGLEVKALPAKGGAPDIMSFDIEGDNFEE